MKKSVAHIPSKGYRRFTALLLAVLLMSSLGVPALASEQPEDSTITDAVEEAMLDRYFELLAKYGDINEWTIPLRAQWSQEEIAAGTLDENSGVWVNLMPGEDDLTEAEARALADKALAEKGVNPDAFLQVLSFYYAYDCQRLWQFTYQGGPDDTGRVVKLNPQGEVVDISAFEAPGSPYIYDLLDLVNGQIVQPQDDELTNAQAADIAWQHFAKFYAEHRARDQYNIVAALRALDTTRYWIITIQDDPTGQPAGQYLHPFDVAVRASTGFIMCSTEFDMYRALLAESARSKQREALEKEKGPFFTWSLEEQAALYPENYAVPQPGQMTQEQAWNIAVQALKQHNVWTEDLLTDWVPYYSFVLPEEGASIPLRWEVNIVNKDELTQLIAGSMEYLDGYYISIDATTGDILWLYTPGDSDD